MNRTEILKALSNPVRLEILEWLKQPEHHFSDQAHPLEMGVCTGQFEKRCGLAQSTVSAHLAVLEKARLVTLERVGQWTFYRRNEPVIAAFLLDMQAALLPPDAVPAPSSLRDPQQGD